MAKSPEDMYHSELLAELATHRKARKDYELFRSFFEAAPLPILFQTVDGKIIECNQAAANLYGYSRREMKQLYATDLMTEDTADKLPCLLEDENKKGGLIVTATNRKKNGDIFPVNVMTKLVAAGGDTYRMVFVSDLSETPEAKHVKPIDQIPEKYFTRDLPDLGEIPELIIETDLSGFVRNANHHFFEISGYDESDIRKGLHLDRLVHPEYKDTVYEQIAKFFQGGQFDVLEYTGMKKDGTPVPLMAHGELIERDGVVQGLRIYIIDLTDHKRLEKNLQSMERFHALGELSGGVVHDINNILFLIHGYVDLQLTKENVHGECSSCRGILEKIKKAAGDGADILKRIQDFTRDTALRETDYVNMNELIEEVVELLRPEWEKGASDRGVAISIVKRLDTVPPIKGKSAEIKEVLNNLIINSVEAMEKDGVITVATKFRDNRIILSVADTGIGMSEEVKSRIFDSFFTTKGENGTGLGLFVTRNIVQKYQGVIEVESSEGAGSIFRVCLPFKAEEPEKSEKRIDMIDKIDKIKNIDMKNHVNPVNPVKINKGALTLEPQQKAPGGEMPEPRQKSTGGEQPPADPAQSEPRKILVIDDEPNICDIMREFLSMEGYIVHTASDGASGLELFKTGLYDAVITDLNMPVLSGIEIAGCVKGDSPGTIVIVLTGWGKDTGEFAGKSAPIDRVISKPVNFGELRDILAALLAGKG